MNRQEQADHDFTGRCIIWMFVLCVEYSVTLGAALDGYKTLATYSGWVGMATLCGLCVGLFYKIYREATGAEE